MEEQKEFLKSQEVQKTLKVQACEIMHLRQEGKLRFNKKGNAYLYYKEDVEKLMNDDNSRGLD